MSRRWKARASSSQPEREEHLRLRILVQRVNQRTNGFKRALSEKTRLFFFGPILLRWLGSRLLWLLRLDEQSAGPELGAKAAPLRGAGLAVDVGSSDLQGWLEGRAQQAAAIQAGI